MFAIMFLCLFALASANYHSLFKAESDVELAKKIDDAHLTSAPELKFVTGLKNLTFSAGTKISLECTVSSKPSASIVWFFNGKPLQGNHIVNLEEKILNIGNPIVDSSILKSTHVIDCPAADDSGIYSCIATNSHLTITSTANINIEPSHSSCNRNQEKAPRIVEWTDFRMEMDQNSASLRCLAENAEQLNWTFKGKTINPTHKYQLLPRGILLIKNITFSHDKGDYTRTASNKYSEDSKEVTLYPSTKNVFNL